MKLLVTGAAGFIGFHVARRLLERGDEVVGLDNLNAYYDPALKAARRAILEREDNFRFVELDLADRAGMQALFEREKFQRVVHLAAQAGVRHSITHPHVYVDSNVTGFLHVLEGCRHGAVEHLVYASTSSVYGANTHLPFSEHDSVDHPLTLYAATKKANELMAHSYSSLHGLPLQLWSVAHDGKSTRAMCKSRSVFSVESTRLPSVSQHASARRPGVRTWIFWRHE